MWAFVVDMRTRKRSDSRAIASLFSWIVSATCLAGIVFCVSCTQRATTSAIRKSTESVAVSVADKGNPTDIVLILDQSGSMNGTPQSPPTDPNKIRIEASKYLINSVARRSKTRIGIVSFGSEAQVDSPLVALNSPTEVETLCGKLAARNMGNSSFVAALAAAMKLFKEGTTFQQGIKPVMIIFTDGAPDDGRKRPQLAYFDEISALVNKEMVPERCDLYVVGVDDTGKNWSKSQADWQRMLGEEKVLTITDMNQLRQAFNHIMHPEMRVDNVTSKGAEFYVPPYLDSIELHVFPTTPGLELIVQRPNGATVAPGKDPDVQTEQLEGYQILTVCKPAVGKWQYRVAQGDGTIEVYRNPIPIQVQVISPHPVEPLGRGFVPQVALKRQDGSFVAELPDYPLRLVARVVKPGELQPKDILLVKSGDYEYVAAESLPADTEGKWEMNVLVSGGHEYSFNAALLFEVEQRPYLDISEPTKTFIPLGRGLAVHARVLTNGQPINVSQWFSDPALNLIIAQLKNLPQGGDSEAVFLDPIDNGVGGEFRGYVPVRLSMEGPTMLALQLRGTAVSTGAKTMDTAVHAFSVARSARQIWLARLRAGGILVLVLASLVMLTGVVWYFRRPVMSLGGAMATVESNAGAISDTYLDNRRIVWLRARKHVRDAIRTQTLDPTSLGETFNVASLPRHVLIYSERARASADDESSYEGIQVIVRTLWDFRKGVRRLGERFDLTSSGDIFINIR